MQIMTSAGEIVEGTELTKDEAIAIEQVYDIIYNEIYNSINSRNIIRKLAAEFIITPRTSRSLSNESPVPEASQVLEVPKVAQAVSEDVDEAFLSDPRLPISDDSSPLF